MHRAPEAGSESPDASLELRCDRRDGRAVVAVEGEVDVATAPLLEEFLDAVDGDVVIDLTDVGFLDSSGIATLVRTRLRADRAGATLTLHNPQVPVRRVLEITGLDDWIEQR